MKISLLIKPINSIINCTENNKINMLKEFYKRLIVPFYLPVLMLVSYF